MPRLLPTLLLSLCPVLPLAAADAVPVALLGTFRPLAALPPAEAGDSFEQALLRDWSARLGRPLQLVADAAEAQVHLGPQEAGLAYYQSEPAALTRSEGGLADLTELAGQGFCVVQGSPYAAPMAERFAATARHYPSAAHALVGLKRGECAVVIEDRGLLETVAEQPEWRRHARLLPSLPELAITFRVQAQDPALQSALQPVVDRSLMEKTVIDAWINEVVFQAYVLSDTLDCH